MESSSESAIYNNSRQKHTRDVIIDNISIPEKIGALANTLQDTSSNLNKVDQMLDQYREHTDDHRDNTAALQEGLEMSIHELQSQHMKRFTGGCSTSHSTLHTNSLKDCIALGIAQIHSLHQVLRDLHSDQVQLGHEINQEILKRKRTDTGTRNSLADLTSQIEESLTEKAVSLRVERRLQKIENEMLSHRQVVSDRHCEKQRSSVTGELQELNSARKELDRSEARQSNLLQQMDEIRTWLLQSERERGQLLREILLLLCHPRSLAELRSGPARLGLRQGGTELEREHEGLCMNFGQNSNSNEAHEFRRTVEHKESEKQQLVFQVETLSSDLERRDHQEVQMLKEIQALSEDRVAQQVMMKSQLAENEKKREVLQTKAQEAVRQWKARCRKLEIQLQELKEIRCMNKPLQALVEREYILRQQVEGTRKQLTEVLAHLAQREEDVRQCNVDLTEARSQLMILKRELRKSKEYLQCLKDETQKQSLLETRLREENQKLVEQLKDLGHQREQEQRTLLELQASVKSLNSECANLNSHLAKAENCRRKLENMISLVQEEKASLGQQLQLEREVHQRELDHLRMPRQKSKIKQNFKVQKTPRLSHQEREELKALVKDLKTEAEVDKELVRGLQRKLERMKAECDKLTQQLSSSEESCAKLQKMYLMVKKDRVFTEQEELRRQTVKDSMAELYMRIADLKEEQAAILHAVGRQIDLVCKALSKESAAKLKAVMLTLGQQNDPHHWLAEMKTKLQWLCDEVHTYEAREKKMVKKLQQCREEMKMLKQSRDSEQHSMQDRITQLEGLLQDIQSEKKEVSSLGLGGTR